jgi:hypothetical protein
VTPTPAGRRGHKGRGGSSLHGEVFARLKSLLTTVAVSAALALAPAAPAVAQGASIPCSEVFGEEVKGRIVFTPSGTPSVFTCTGGIFNEPPTGFQLNIPCSDLFGEEVKGRIVFTQGGVSVFTCQGGPFQ